MSNRQIVIDTETTGLNSEDGHRIIEIGGVELINRKFTGNNFHVYINPERNIERGAANVHGLTTDFLKDKPKFAAICLEFLEYVKGAELIIHNAPFDLGFLNYEMRLCGKVAGALTEYVTVFDTLSLARKKHPGQRNNLDALCKRYNVDNSHRDLHGALLDAKLLANIYLAMTGGQISLFDDIELDELNNVACNEKKFAYSSSMTCDLNPTSVIYANTEELELHREFLKKMRESSGVDVLFESIDS